MILHKIPKSNRGRPVTAHRVHEIMKKKRCSRVWAYELLRREKASAAAAQQVGDAQKKPG